MSQQLYSLSLDAIKYICNLINQTVDLPSTILDDLHIATNTTYSSYKLDTLLKALKEENIEYCDAAIAGLNKLSKEIITDKSQITNENTIYLLLTDAAKNVYEQWLLINGTPTMIGTTEMNLDNVYTKDEADARYSLLTDFNDLKDSFDALKDEIGTETLSTTSQTVKGAINEVKTSVPTDDDIKSLADGQIDSKKQILGFNDLKGITADSTLDDVVKAVPNGKIAILQSANFTNYLGLPHQMYTITINSLGYNRNQIIATAKYSKNPSVSFIGGCDNSSGTDIYDQWLKIPTTNDITTTISSASTDAQMPSAKSVYTKIKGVRIDTSNIDMYGTEILKYPIGKWIIGTTTAAEQFTDLPVKFAGIIDIETIGISDINTPWGNAYNYRLYTFKTYNENTYIRKIGSASTAGTIVLDTGWQRVVTTKVDDVPRTAITFSNTTNYTTITSSFLNYYIVKNGMCYVSLDVSVASKTNDWVTVYTLPKPASPRIDMSHSFVDEVGDSYMAYGVWDDGTLKIKSGENTIRYVCSLSYPVAES